MGGCRPKAAAGVVAEPRSLAPDGVLQLVLAVVGGYDEENVVQLGVAVVLEVADEGADLLAQASQRLGRPVPLQVEQDAAAGRQPRSRRAWGQATCTRGPSAAARHGRAPHRTRQASPRPCSLGFA